MMMVRPFGNFFTAMRFSKEATSWARAKKQNRTQITIVWIQERIPTEVKRNFIQPPQKLIQNSKLRGGGEDCQTSSCRKKSAPKVEGHVDQHDHDGHFDQGADDGSECCPGINTENRNGYGNRKFEII
jgi:hypothetical protein